MWRTRVSLLPKIAALVTIQIAAFVLLFWWLNCRSNHRSLNVTTKPAVTEATPAPK
jgi:hypothetical protein